MKFLNHKIVIILLFSFFLSSCSSLKHYFAGKKDISPYDYGLAEAKTGVERYNVLLETHKAAGAKGVNVNYSGIDTLLIEIPGKPSSIPPTQYNDFKGCVFIVKNTSKNCWLFRIEEKETPINVPKKLIDDGDFRSLDALKKGRYILLIEDENPWVLNRKGHGYGHQRKDILLIENGKAKNSVIMPYDNDDSSPVCSYIKVKNEPFVFKNLTIIRDEACSFLTHIAYISGFDNVKVSDVSIYTPPSTLTDDRGIRIYNSTNVTFDNVRINGTYSQKDHSGYGISLNNVWNFKVYNMYGNGNWGVFGTNNVNTVHINDSQINRFDIHCYGRDLFYDKVDFFDRFNSHASVFGKIVFNNCTFTDFVPSQYGGSYNAFVAHDIELYNCVFNVTPKRNYFCRPMDVSGEINKRHELSKKCLPNIRIKNLTVNMAEDVKEFYLFFIKKSDSIVLSFDGIKEISVEGLTINAAPRTPLKNVQLCNRPIETVNDVNFTIKDVVINQPKAGTRINAILKFNMPVKEGMLNISKIENLIIDSK